MAERSTIDLNGEWTMYYGPETDEGPESVEEAVSAGWTKLSVRVPGNVELYLHEAGKEPDPFWGANLYRYLGYEYHGWLFTRRFEVTKLEPEERIFLCCEGIDTISEIFLNGRLLASTRNMLVGHEFDVTDFVEIGSANEIRIRIHSAMREAAKRPYPVRVVAGEFHDESALLRKPAHSFGWDIAPRFVSAGIWRDIKLERRPARRIRELYLATVSLGRSSATIAVRYRLGAEHWAPAQMELRIAGTCAQSHFEKSVPVDFVSGSTRIEVADPLLWWPRNFGAANLYELTVELMVDGEVVDRRELRFGIRTMELERGGRGNDFTFRVNGVPVYLTGTNWVPLDAFHSRDLSRLEEAVRLLHDVGCNAVRCWGGNVYEHDRFFNLCDELGILVWQDFSFACAVYPEDSDFLLAVTEEAAKVIQRLRNHACLALWCGDNEIDQTLLGQGYVRPHCYHNPISREVLPAAVSNHDPYRDYLPSSPFLEDPKHGQYSAPEQHLWGPRDYFKSDFYRNATAKFVSEIGYHGCPAVGSIKKFVSLGKEPSWGSDEWQSHSAENVRKERRRYDRNELMRNQVRIFFGEEPRDLTTFALASQIVQAEAKKYFIERARIRRPAQSGLLWWNLLDCWPQFSDAVVDYYFVKKLAYYYIRRVQSEVCLMVDELDTWNYRVVIDNITRHTAEAAWSVSNGETGEPLLEGRSEVAANSNKVVGTVAGLPGEHRFLLLRWTIGEHSKANHYITGFPPYSVERYSSWLEKIAAVEEPFDPDTCYR